MISGQIDTEYGKIKYKTDESTAYIIEYAGRDLTVKIPEEIDGKIVKVISKKAFLSQKLVKRIELPSSIEIVEDYAFARCSKLESILIPYKELKLGIDILKECRELAYIENSLGNENIHFSEKQKEDVAYLLAKTLGELEAFFLFDLKNAGSYEWLHHLDATIGMRLKKDDMENFSKMILCGEEEVVCGDDGTIEDSNPEHYKSNRVKEKVRIAFMRLLHNYGINADLEGELISYLLEHTKGCQTEETWQVVMNEHGDEKEYYDYLLKIGAINDNNISDVLTDMGNRHTEIKSYLITINSDSNNDDTFSDFEL